MGLYFFYVQVFSFGINLSRLLGQHNIILKKGTIPFKPRHMIGDD